MSEIRGRRLFAILAPVVVASAAFMGAIVGGNAAQRGEAIVVFGLFSVPSSPLWLGLYAAVWATAVIGALYGLVAVASRFDDAAT